MIKNYNKLTKHNFGLPLVQTQAYFLQIDSNVEFSSCWRHSVVLDSAARGQQHPKLHSLPREDSFYKIEMSREVCACAVGAAVAQRNTQSHFRGFTTLVSEITNCFVLFYKSTQRTSRETAET